MPAVIEGRFIRLEPLTVELLPALHAAIAHPEVYSGGYGGGPLGFRPNLADFTAWAKTWALRDTHNGYLIRVRGGASDGVAIGTTTLGDFDADREHAHIGWTAYDPRVWGTQVNPEAKRLLLALAFDSGFGRVKIQTDVLNDRSRAAILRLGAQFEGILRRDSRRADGTWRDTAVYSILIDEWPAVSAALDERLAGWGAAPLQFRQS